MSSWIQTEFGASDSSRLTPRSELDVGADDSTVNASHKETSTHLRTRLLA
eukprot:JP441359.1.p2 GENE.JP441359.1~~JP441359.1.p2  ORF type:complete len:50 (+),score=2.06 JP441359.1:111-260(+)